jgi:hypothetical protein
MKVNFENIVHALKPICNNTENIVSSNTLFKNLFYCFLQKLWIFLNSETRDLKQENCLQYYPR